MVDVRANPETPPQAAELRSVAQLRFLHALALRLNALDDTQAIGEAITGELRSLIDYHNCRIYLLQPDGKTLWPIAFRGSLGEYEDETIDELVTEVGEGVTGHAVATGETYYARDAVNDPLAVQIDGTEDIDESILCVPMRVGDHVNGVIVLSNLGVDQFDDEDVRVMEVLASHSAVAFENARLLQQERDAAEMASALLGLSQALTGARDTAMVLERAVAAVPTLLDGALIAAFVRDPSTGVFRLHAHRGIGARTLDALREIPGEVGTPLLASLDDPFVLPAEAYAALPPEYLLSNELRPALVIPIGWDPDGLAVLVTVASSSTDTYDERSLSLARGIRDIASLALGSARRVHELERFHELVESLDAIFWEADADGLRFTFLSRRAALVLGRTTEDPELRTWGDHVHPDDLERVRAGLRDAVDGAPNDVSLEYRALGPEGEPMWLRDHVHVARDARNVPQVRGLIVDITDRKRAEQALKRSEQQYSDAFRREREATLRLRALDDMKNTFLEAVSHDLRTPLTSILGSALTLEQAGLDIPREDALDLLRRIAANARKLERLLSDLLDLDRLQRGIVAPQRRPTDLGNLVRQVVHETELLGEREVRIEAEQVEANVDGAKVERIVENLLANAARHTPPGTPLWVWVTKEPLGALLIVDDAGPGVPDDLKEAVFEPFRQGAGPNPSPGVGIGLSLVARFAELHGGSAWVQDRPGGGASFRVYLPDA
ncbi:MAG TPA: ATP-binding protein [Actinomycetota bacterium]|nr:ATP-binding protein [Actinomycetota bacterium]